MDYQVSIREVSREMSPRERIKIKDFTNATQLDAACEEGSFILSPDVYAVLDVHNERSKEDKDYVKYIILDKGGNKYITGSNSFFKSFLEIWEEMAPLGEDFEIEVYKVPSKNYKGKSFLTCSIV